jgi:hypothetical protein
MREEGAKKVHGETRSKGGRCEMRVDKVERERRKEWRRSFYILCLHEPTPSFNSSSRRSRPAQIQVRIQDSPHVVRCRQVREEGNEVGEFGVVRVVKPGRDGDGVVRVEDVGRGRVVDDDRVFHGAAELGKVL